MLQKNLGQDLLLSAMVLRHRRRQLVIDVETHGVSPGSDLLGSPWSQPLSQNCAHFSFREYQTPSLILRNLLFHGTEGAACGGNAYTRSVTLNGAKQSTRHSTDNGACQRLHHLCALCTASSVPACRSFKGKCETNRVKQGHEHPKVQSQTNGLSLHMQKFTMQLVVLR